LFHTLISDIRPLLENTHEIDSGKGPVRQEGTHIENAMGQEVALAELNHFAMGSDTLPARVQQVPGQRV
jgi:hypothetical protein